MHNLIKLLTKQAAYAWLTQFEFIFVVSSFLRMLIRKIQKCHKQTLLLEALKCQKQQDRLYF